jgi:hypothetical protein
LDRDWHNCWRRRRSDHRLELRFWSSMSERSSDQRVWSHCWTSHDMTSHRQSTHCCCCCCHHLRQWIQSLLTSLGKRSLSLATD